MGSHGAAPYSKVLKVINCQVVGRRIDSLGQFLGGKGDGATTWGQ